MTDSKDFSPYTSKITEIDINNYDYAEIALSTVSPQLPNFNNVDGMYFDNTMMELKSTGDRVDTIKRALYYPGAPSATFPNGQLNHLAYFTKMNMDVPAITDLLHAGLGMVTESIEFLENVVRILRRPYCAKDIIGLIEEMGDNMWYHPVAIRGISILLGEITELDVAVLNNIKLALRMRQKGKAVPSVFDGVAVLNRDINNELSPIAEFVKEKRPDLFE